MPMQAAMSKHNLAYESEHWVLVQQSENGKMSCPADSPQSWSTNNALHHVSWVQWVQEYVQNSSLQRSYVLEKQKLAHSQSHDIITIQGSTLTIW